MKTLEFFNPHREIVAAYLRRVGDGDHWVGYWVALTIVHAASQQNSAQVFSDVATIYKVDATRLISR
jgi:hypothetical protein